MMDKREFADEVAKVVDGIVKEVEKANGIKLISIMKKGVSLSPNVYIDDMYDSGMTIYEAADEVKQAWNIAPPERFGEVTQWIQNWTKVRTKLVARLYNSSTNADVFKSAKGYGFSDLIIVPYVSIGDGGYIKVTKALVNSWGVTEKTVISKAMENSKSDTYEIVGLNVMISRLLRQPLPPADEFAYVLMNSTGVCGAIGAITMKKELKERWPNGYTVLPSSIHEVIILPGKPEVGVQAMVREINRGVVRPEEVLSNNVYTFNLAA